MGEIKTVHELWALVRTAIRKALEEIGVDQPVEPIRPPDPAMGHLGFPVFSLARTLRRPPDDIARDVAARLPKGGLFQAVVPFKGYVNLFLDHGVLAAAVLGEIYRKRERFAAGGAVAGQTAVVEYSSPNTNKPLHLGHVRNNLLGLSVTNLLAYYGNDVSRVNLVNDRGVHICKTMLAYRMWGDGATPESTGRKGDHFVGDLYVRFEREFKKEFDAWRTATGSALEEDEYFNGHSPLGQSARELLRAWESGDAETVDLWTRMNRWVLAGFEATYARMGCVFDLMQFESDTYKLGKAMVAEGLDRGLFGRRDDGAVVLDLTQVGLTGDKVLLRSDGTSLYMTQDIGTAAWRVDHFRPDRLIYVVGDEQNYHFSVLFKVLDMLRPGIGKRCFHLSYGMVRLPEGKMKSREGKVVDADDLMDELKSLAVDELRKRAGEGREHHEKMSADELDVRAERIAQAALKFFVLRFTPRKSFEYDPKQSIDFNGQTGPYCLYTVARTRSLVRKSGWVPEFDPELVGLLQDEQEKDVVRRLFDFSDVVERSVESLDPSKVAEYTYDLAATFARMFTDRNRYPILGCEEKLTRARLMLADAVGTAVRSGLALLGIETLEEM